MLNADGTIKFKQWSKEDEPDVQRIIERAREMFARFGHRLDVLSLRMDLAAVNAVIPLDFMKLANFDNFNLSHDIGGILKHMNRETGDLEDCFVPRCAATQVPFPS